MLASVPLLLVKQSIITKLIIVIQFETVLAVETSFPLFLVLWYEELKSLNQCSVKQNEENFIQ